MHCAHHRIHRNRQGVEHGTDQWIIFGRRGRRNGGGQHHTGLAFNRSKKHGRVWRLPDTPLGRTAADIIDAKLADLAAELADESGRDR